MLNRFLALAAALALTGCGTPLATAGAVASFASLNTTKKALVDHAVSANLGKDCSLVSFEQTGEYCPSPAKPVDRSKVYCYRTIADIDCHPVPDPYKNGARPVADPPLLSPRETENLNPVIHGAPLEPMAESSAAPVRLTKY